ncbi:hypothetical protein DEJ30_11955 [Curtobacterium sp. MCPF17_003]|uniref:hypothetical protein n=1 Tax=Curtobacterium sp. MCPF17_003 TaxID=2175637 RepID=UPI000D91DD8F|nr:hypothetical protein [Curtobacterium sp. MCPF17_003]PYY63620.1 hypothetical protein DEJ30_11955 [Curtobacterium sp. MCPF17_003]
MSEDDKTKQTEGATLEEKLAAAEAEAEKWKTLSRQNEQRAKDNAEKAKKFDEHEEATKTELDKLKERAEAAEKVNAEREAKEAAAKLREEIATEKGFGDRKINASALRGSTREELEAHADELLALVPAPAAGPSADGQGKTGEQIGEGDMSAEDIVAAATAR